MREGLFSPLLVPAGRPGYVLDDSRWHDPASTELEQRAESAIRKQELVEAILADVEGDPPALISAAIALGPRRAKFARYVAWRRKLEGELAALEAKRTELDAMVAAPAETAATIRGAVKRTADWLLGRDGADNSDEAGRKLLEDNLAAQRHRAESAQEALPEIGRTIEVAQMRVKRLVEREKEFLSPALAELADEAGLGHRYRRAIKELRSVLDLLNGLAAEAGGFDSGFDTPATIAFPQMAAVSSNKSVLKEEFIIRAASASRQAWRDAAVALFRDPFAKAGKLIPSR